MKLIDPAELILHLIPMDIFVNCEPITIDLVYANANHPRNIFKTAIYHDKARLWAHCDMALITIMAARKLYKEHHYTLELKDCLRTFEAQEAMQETDIVKANPHWCIGEDRLLAPPGAGAHPRGMAIDACVLDIQNFQIDMGTEFDTMTAQSHRNYIDFPKSVLKNRKILEESFLSSAKQVDLPFIGLQSEWWDYRFSPDYTRLIQPLSDKNLPPQMQMTHQIDNNIADFPQEHFDKLAQEIITKADGYLS